jgi:stage II sporulation protein Q
VKTYIEVKIIMKRKIKIKKLGVLILILVLIPILTIVYLMNKSLSKEPVNVDYTTDSIINETLPVVNTKETIMYPYNDSSVTIGKSYYDYLSDASSQENSIILRDDTYIQNTGIDYVSENTFEVLSILEGTVISVKEDDNVGKTVEIKHSNNYISIYQSLSEVSVKKGDIVQSNQVIGISGTNELDKDLGNHLHFELYIKGQSVNPELYLNKEVNINEE